VAADGLPGQARAVQEGGDGMKKEKSLGRRAWRDPNGGRRVVVRPILNSKIGERKMEAAKNEKVDAVEGILTRLDDCDDNEMIIGVIVGLLMRSETTRERVLERLEGKWLERYTSSATVEDAVSSGFEDELAMLFSASRLPSNGGDVVGSIALQHNPMQVMLAFFRQLSDRDKLLLSAFDSYLRAGEKQEHQNAVRAAIDDFDPARIPAEYQFLLGVKYAAEGVAAA